MPDCRRVIELNVAALLMAIAAVETGNNPEIIGKKDEVSQYQITPAVWRKYSPTLKFNPKVPWTAQAVATKHLRYLNEQLPLDLKGRPYWLAVAWNGGMGAVNKAKVKGEYSSRHVPEKVQNYADRVRAMYHVYEKDPRCVKKTPK